MEIAKEGKRNGENRVKDKSNREGYRKPKRDAILYNSNGGRRWKEQ